MMNLNSNDAKFGGQFMGNFGGMEINSLKKWDENWPKLVHFQLLDLDSFYNVVRMLKSVIP